MTMETVEEIVRDYEAEIAEAPERLKAAQGLAQTGLQSLTLVNGGALIALFTVIGAGKIKLDMVSVWWAFAAFALGIAAAQASFLLGYLSQNDFYQVSMHRAWNLSNRLAGRQPSNDEDGPRRRGTRALYGAIAGAFLSIAGFIAGAGFALFSVT